MTGSDRREPAPVWQDLPSFRHFGRMLKVFGNSLWGLFEYLSIFWTYIDKNVMVLGKFFIVVKGQILKNDLVIWSHWPSTKNFF